MRIYKSNGENEHVLKCTREREREQSTVIKSLYCLLCCAVYAGGFAVSHLFFAFCILAKISKKKIYAERAAAAVAVTSLVFLYLK